MKAIESVNSYNIYDANYSGTILYHALAIDESQVRQLAKEANIDLDGLTIDLERKNVRDELGRSYSPGIEDAQIQ
jgi:hypothetical protein